MNAKKTISALSHEYIVNDSLHQLFDAVNAISVQGYDEERRVIYWNKGSELLYGFTKEEATGKKIENLIIPKPMCEVVIAAHSIGLRTMLRSLLQSLLYLISMAIMYLFIQAMSCLLINIIRNKCIVLILIYPMLYKRKNK